MNSQESLRFSANQFIAMARRLYNRVPVRLRWIIYPFIYLLRLFLKLRLKLWIATGDEITSGMTLSILCATNYWDTTLTDGEVIRKINYLCELALGNSFKEYYHGRTWLWKLAKLIEKKDTDYSFVIVQVDKSNLNLLKSPNWFFIPDWVIGEINTPLDEIVTKNSSIKSDLRRIRKHSLHYEVTQDPHLFDEFYHNMYVPHITKAHFSNAYIMSYDYMRAEFQNSELLLVKKQEKRIAGILIAYEEVPRLWSLGVRDSNPEYIKDGAVGALFYYSLLYLKGKGYSTINFGLSRPFLRDGVLQYKRKWTQRIVGTTSYGYALKVLNYTDPAKAFLQKNPFIFESHEELQGAVFVNADKALSSEELQKIDKKYFYDGLSKLYVYHFHNVEAIEQDSIPPELSDRIVLRSAADMA
jgi:hypothetical protein